MASPLAQVAELEKRLRLEVGSLEGTDLQAAEDALDDASALVRGVGLASWTAANVPDDVRLVVIRVALRQYRNPEGFRGEAMGSGAYSYTLADDETSAYLTGAEEATIARAVAAASPAGSGSGSVRVRSGYVPTAAEPVPWWWGE